MRPRVAEERTELYECFSCGGRTSETETLVCDSCGGQLRHLGKSRDL